MKLEEIPILLAHLDGCEKAKPYARQTGRTTALVNAAARIDAFFIAMHTDGAKMTGYNRAVGWKPDVLVGKSGPVIHDHALVEHALRIAYDAYLETKDMLEKPKEMPVEYDPVERPKHYNMGKIQPIEFIEDQKFGYSLGNAVKYITRCRHKGKFVEDLEKAIWYIKRAIEQEENL